MHLQSHVKDIYIFRANYNHEIHIFLKVNFKLLINKKISNKIIRPALSCYRRNKIKIKNLSGPALSSHAERSGAVVDFLKMAVVL